MKRSISIVVVMFVALVAGRSTVGAQAAPDTRVVGVSWWTQSPTASAPDGGFVIGGRLDGPQSAAVVQVDVGSGATSLTIGAVESGGTATDLAGIRVCAVAEPWEPADGGALADAPTFDCNRTAPFTRDESGAWSADVTSLAGGVTGVVDLGLAPDPPDPAAPSTLATFEVVFDAPSVVAATARPTTTTSTSPASAPPTSPTFTVPSAPVVAPTTVPAVGPATTTTFVTGNAAPLPPLPRAGDPGTSWTEAFVLVLIAGLVGALVAGVSKLASLKTA